MSRNRSILVAARLDEALHETKLDGGLRRQGKLRDWRCLSLSCEPLVTSGLN